jgi:hypothetical protein
MAARSANLVGAAELLRSAADTSQARIVLSRMPAIRMGGQWHLY